MFDLKLRPLKDAVFNPLVHAVPKQVLPLHITMLAFAVGLASCLLLAHKHQNIALLCWVLNRILDCMDGAVARRRNATSDLGGFLDLLSDFIIYSLIPICCFYGASDELWSSIDVMEARAVTLQISACLALASVEASFHINNFVLFYVGAILEKRKANEKSRREHASLSAHRERELTSVMMSPALVEGVESCVIFTCMMALPQHVTALCWLMAGLVAVGTLQRTFWVIHAL